MAAPGSLRTRASIDAGWLMTPSKVGRSQASDVDFEDDSDDTIIILLLMRKIILTPMTPSKIDRMQ